MKVAGFPPFRPRAPWLGGDLQTLRNPLVGRPADLDPWPGRRLELVLADGSGDRLAAMLHGPSDAGGKPLAVLIHGLTGCEDSLYVRATARCLLTAGYPVLRLNLRGAGPSRPLCRFQYDAGKTMDFRDALVALGGLVALGELDPGLLRPGLVAIGYSLGANMLLKFLAEEGRDVPLRAAVSVSAPIDLKAAQEALMRPRNAVYHRYLLSRMKRDALAAPAEASGAERRAVEEARSVYAFDDRFVAPRGGFAGAEDYYRRCGARRFLPAIDLPTLVIHAKDDPWIPAAAYGAFDWSANRNLVPLLAEGGGHVGFHGAGSATPWHDRCILRFLGEVG